MGGLQGALRLVQHRVKQNSVGCVPSKKFDDFYPLCYPECAPLLFVQHVVRITDFFVPRYKPGENSCEEPFGPFWDPGKCVCVQRDHLPCLVWATMAVSFPHAC